MSIEAMRQALEAWDAYDGGTLDHPIATAMETLRTAIEQAEIKRLQQRQWIGLTDEERRQIALDDPIDWVAAIEAKLKEKNEKN